jgi:hypothetical protein
MHPKERLPELAPMAATVTELVNGAIDLLDAAGDDRDDKIMSDEAVFLIYRFGDYADRMSAALVDQDYIAFECAIGDLCTVVRAFQKVVRGERMTTAMRVVTEQLASQIESLNSDYHADDEVKAAA